MSPLSFLFSFAMLQSLVDALPADGSTIIPFKFAISALACTLELGLLIRTFIDQYEALVSGSPHVDFLQVHASNISLCLVGCISL